MSSRNLHARGEVLRGRVRGLAVRLRGCGARASRTLRPRGLGVPGRCFLCVGRRRKRSSWRSPVPGREAPWGTGCCGSRIEGVAPDEEVGGTFRMFERDDGDAGGGAGALLAPAESGDGGVRFVWEQSFVSQLRRGRDTQRDEVVVRARCWRMGHGRAVRILVVEDGPWCSVAACRLSSGLMARSVRFWLGVAQATSRESRFQASRCWPCADRLARSMIRLTICICLPTGDAA